MEDHRGAELTRLLLILLLSGCSTANHETRSLLCLGFCSEQRMEIKQTTKEKPVKQTIKLPDIPVPGTSVILTNVEVTVEPLLPLDMIQMALIDYIVKNYPPK
jgi:hypothetical protein